MAHHSHFAHRQSQLTWFFLLTRPGYDTGVISAVLVSLGTDLGQALSSNDQELITSITSGGALIGAVLAGMTSDKYGRKLAIYVGCAVFFVGTALQATAFSLAQMVVGRLVVGFGVGEAAMIVPLYIGEMAPARFRGRLIVFDNICVTFGQLIAYALGAAFTDVHQGWRYTIAIGAVPAIALAATMPLCPETPRQLISHGRDDEAKRVIRKIFPQATEQQVVNKIRVVRHSIEEVAASVSDKSLWWQMKQLFTVGANLRALATACSIMAGKPPLSSRVLIRSWILILPSITTRGIQHADVLFRHTVLPGWLQPGHGRLHRRWSDELCVWISKLRLHRPLWKTINAFDHRVGNGRCRMFIDSLRS